MDDYYEVIDFWFDYLEPRQWFEKNKKIDDKIRDKFLNLYTDITCGRCREWTKSPKGVLAIIIVLDQFSRNMFRETSKMYSFDMMALNLAKNALEEGFDKELTPIERTFLYMPFMHSEDLEDQYRCVILFEKLVNEDEKFEKNLEFAKAHRDIILKFKRFPHRNEILDRTSTPLEKEFLKQENSSF